MHSKISLKRALIYLSSIPIALIVAMIYVEITNGMVKEALSRFTFSHEFKNPVYWGSRIFKTPFLVQTPRIGMVVPEGFIGEREVAEYFTKAMNNLKIEYYVFKPKFSDPFCEKLHKIIYTILKPDFIFSFTPIFPPWPGQYNYTWNMIYGPYVNPDSILSPKQRPGFIPLAVQNAYIAQYHGYIDADPTHQWLTAKMVSHGREPIFEHFVPSAQGTEYSPVLPRTIFYCGSNWDNERGKDYKPIFKKLEQAGRLAAYGPKESWQDFEQSYQGFIPFDGHSLIEKIKQAGIALCLHSVAHNGNGIPSARVFQAAAAGVVIISDKNPYIMRNFGDAVLYVDEKTSVNTMYDQIQQHLKWIDQNPKAAQALGSKAHAIFKKSLLLKGVFKNY